MKTFKCLRCNQETTKRNDWGGKIQKYCSQKCYREDRGNAERRKRLYDKIDEMVAIEYGLPLLEEYGSLIITGEDLERAKKRTPLETLRAMGHMRS